MNRQDLKYHLNYLLLIVLLALPLVCVFIYDKKFRSFTDQIAAAKFTAFSDGTYDASGLVDVPGTDGVLFVDNKRNGQVMWMQLDSDGKQKEAVKSLDLGIEVEDLEALTADETHFYSISSQSKPKMQSGASLVRFKFDSQNKSVSGVESLSGLKDFLTANVAELRGYGNLKGKDGGLNIEGMGWDPVNQRLLIGLRSPIVDGNALLIPVKFRDSHKTFSINNLEVENGRAIRLPLGGVGIRGIEYNRQTKVYQLLSGAAEDQEQADFGVWKWNGDANHSQVRQINKFDKSLKPEGIAQVTIGNKDFTFVVFDASGYTVMQ